MYFIQLSKEKKTIFCYEIHGVVLKHARSICNLGVLLYLKLKFNAHVDSKASRVIRYIRRNYFDFKNITGLKVLRSLLFKIKLFRLFGNLNKII